MARKLKVSSIGASQLTAPAENGHAALVNHAIAAWRGWFEQVLPDRPDLIVVPEMCDSYPHLSPETAIDYYDARGDQVLHFFQETAQRNNCYLTYPAVRRAADGRLFNSVRLIDRLGQVVGTYDKNHVVINETTEGQVLCGSSAPVFETELGRVAFAICFDLNFDELRAQYVAARPELILFPSLFHGSFLQQYWAYSCRAYFVSAISIASLPSTITSPVGEVVATSTPSFDYLTHTINLDYTVAHFDFNGEKLRALKQKYGPEVLIHDPGKDLGSVLISSESESITAAEMAASVELELLDDYLERSREHHHTLGSSNGAPRQMMPGQHAF